MRQPARTRESAYAEEVDRGLVRDFLRQLRPLREQIYNYHLRMVEDWDFSVKVFGGNSEESAELAHLVESERTLLEAMARQAMPPNLWIRHGRKLLYLNSDSGPLKGNGVFDLVRLDKRDECWIPRGVSEEPYITKRRAEYADYRARSIRLIAAVPFSLFLIHALVNYLVGGTPQGALLAATTVFTCGMSLALLLETRSFLKALLFGDGVPAPFEQFAPGTGEPSPQVRRAREKREGKAADAVLKRAVPQPKGPMRKTHEYHYEYEGFHPDAQSSYRVRIYQGVNRNRQRPIILLSQTLPPPNLGTSLTNLIEAVSAEVVLSELPQFLPANALSALVATRRPPVTVVQHYTEGNSLAFPMEGNRDGESFAFVTFESYRIQSPLELPARERLQVDEDEYEIVRGNHTERPRFGEPHWINHVGRETVERMVGEEV